MSQTESAFVVATVVLTSVITFLVIVYLIKKSTENWED